MKQLFIMLTVFLSITSVQADPGRTLTDPSDTLQANDCVFKNKGIVALSEYEYIVDKCDRRYTNLLMIAADHLPQGACVYKLVQKMTGHTIAHVVQQCPTAVDNQEIQGIVPDAPLEEVQQDDEGHMPPAPGQAPVKKAAKPKAKPQGDAQQQQQPTDEIGVLKLKAETLNEDAVAAEANLVQAQKEYAAEKAKGANANQAKLDKLASDLEDVKAIARNARESANTAKAEYQNAVKQATPAAAPKAPVKPKTNQQVEKGKQGYYLNPDEIEF